MRKYHDLKNKHVLNLEDTILEEKSSITRLIEIYNESGTPLDEKIFKNINYQEIFKFDYHVNSSNGSNWHMVEEQTIAENIMYKLPLDMYKDLMDITWLKTRKEERQLISNLIYKNKYDVIYNFLDLIKREDKKYDFEREIFEPIFSLEHHLRNKIDLNLSSSVNISKYLKLVEDTLVVYEDFYKEKYKQYGYTSKKIKDVKKWHKNFSDIYSLNKDSKIENINSLLLKSKESYLFIKNIIEQYDKLEDNKLLNTNYFIEAIKNANEKVIDLYLAKYTKNKYSSEKIESLFYEALKQSIDEFKKEINESFRSDYKNNYSDTYNIDKIYWFCKKYTNKEINPKIFTECILINDDNFQNNFLKKILPTSKVEIENLNINQWKHIGVILEELMSIHDSSYEQSIKQRENRFPRECKDFVNENPYKFNYIINRVNKLYPGIPESITEKELNEVFNYIKNNIEKHFSNKNIDVNKYRLNNKLQSYLTEKPKLKKSKI